ncbi:VWA domain-containing protein, partial [Gammaproteobacteria bacterium]|nr:VWA domain-containing protein [Gammaproteobacteria bacterium]
GELAAAAPVAVNQILSRLDSLLTQLTFDGLRRWAMLGVQSHMRDPDAQARFFNPGSKEGNSLLRAESDKTVFAAVEHRLSLYTRALWGRTMKLRPVVQPDNTHRARRSAIDDNIIRLPNSYPGFVRQSGVELYRAAVAHASAHLVFTRVRFAVGTLKPLQVALISLIEDARVEQLAVSRYPGLKNLWKKFHVAQPGGTVTAVSLMARLARSLIDDEYTDDSPWVERARKLFFDQREYWEDQSISRMIGGLIGNDLGQMRVQFNVRTFVVEPVYRDDNTGLWNFADTGQPGAEDEDVIMQGARLTEGEDTQRERIDEEESGAAREEQVKMVTPNKEVESLEEEPLSPPKLYDEWDYLISRDRPAWCTLIEKVADEGDADEIEEILDRHHNLVNRIKYLVKAVQVQRPVRLKKRLEGERLDLDACIDATIDMRIGIPPDPRVHQSVGRQQRDLSVLVLLDLSKSTNDVIQNSDTTVLDLAREATVLLADAMARIGDHFAIHGFSSNTRHDVGYFRFKDFDRPYGALQKARLAAMAGHLSTRMGTALRHAGSFLRDRKCHKKLILLVTDGEPSDIDVHDPEYLVVDTKKAVEENNRYGIFTYCMSLDPKADRYVKRIFGMRNYFVVDHIRRLPEKLPLLYIRVTH